ncbi:MAG: hypothetical protein ABI564_04525 [Ideonella sp.]
MMSAQASTGSASVHCQPSPGARLAFVFICPGRFEASRGYPCAAGTGANLARVLIELNRRAPALFPSPQRAAYVITNAWAQVEYPALTGRSVPSESEVLEPSNLMRLESEIAAVERVIACGAQAHAAMRAIAARRPALEVAYARHLSQRSVNMIAGGSNTAERIARWADLVLGQLPGTAGGLAAWQQNPSSVL